MKRANVVKLFLISVLAFILCSCGSLNKQGEVPYIQDTESPSDVVPYRDYSEKTSEKVYQTDTNPKKGGGGNIEKRLDSLEKRVSKNEKRLAGHEKRIDENTIKLGTVSRKQREIESKLASVRKLGQEMAERNSRSTMTKQEKKEYGDDIKKFTVFFERNKTTLSKKEKKLLNDFLKKNKGIEVVVVIGSTDPTGSRFKHLNEQLSVNRIESILSTLKEKGISYENADLKTYVETLQFGLELKKNRRAIIYYRD